MNSIVTIVGVCLLAAIGEGYWGNYGWDKPISKHWSNEKNFHIRCSFENPSENSTEKIQLVKIDQNTKTETIFNNDSRLLVDDTKFQLTKEIDDQLIDVSYLKLKFLSTRPSDSGLYECRKIDSENKILVRANWEVLVDPKPVRNEGTSIIHLYVCATRGCINRRKPWKPHQF